MLHISSFRPLVQMLVSNSQYGDARTIIILSALVSNHYISMSTTRCEILLARGRSRDMRNQERPQARKAVRGPRRNNLRHCIPNSIFMILPHYCGNTPTYDLLYHTSVEKKLFFTVDSFYFSIFDWDITNLNITKSKRNKTSIRYNRHHSRRIKWIRRKRESKIIHAAGTRNSS